jgi:rhamnosyltransferase
MGMQPLTSLESVAVIVPTLNAGENFQTLLSALSTQGLAHSQILIIDSSSDDETVARAREFGARTEIIERKDFNHGTTRRYAASLCKDAEILVLITQDAIPATPNAILQIVSAFSDPQVGMAFGRQLPRPQAGAIERHARLHNYPAVSGLRSLSDCATLGIKTVFCSNSFAAYRHSALESVGSFPPDTYFAEDQIVAAHMLLSGQKLAYVSNAQVYHSHDYKLAEEFRRYFDVGVFHARNTWMLQAFGRPEGEGLVFAASEFTYLLKQAPIRIPSALLRTLAKCGGYYLGRREANLPTGWKARLSMQPFYWRRKHR